MHDAHSPKKCVFMMRCSFLRRKSARKMTEKQDPMSRSEAFEFHIDAIKTAFGLPLICTRERNESSARFSAEVAVRNLGDASVGSLESEDYCAKLTPASLASETISFVFLEQGTTAIGQDGRFTVMKPGSLFFFNTARPADFLFFTRFRQHVLHLPKAAIEPYFPAIDDVTAVAIDRTGNFSLLWNLVKATAADDSAEKASPESIRDLTGAFASLAAIGLADLFGARLTESPNEKAVRLMAKRFMLDHLSDSELSAPLIAKGCGVSRRTLYSAFEADGGVMAALWAFRLARAREMLLSPWCRSMSAAEIGFACGFKSQAHFSSRFKAAYNLPPAKYRAESA